MLNPDGSFVYTPTPGLWGTDTFTYHANDGTDNSNVATVTIQVNGVPIAVGDSYPPPAVTEDVQLIIAAPGLLANDTDPNGDPLSVLPVPITPPAHGNVVLDVDGSFTYTPDPNYNGPDWFEYAITDGQMDSAPATVNLVVSPVNDPPTAVNDSAWTNMNQPISIYVLNDLLTFDFDIDGEPVLLDSPDTAATVGGVATRNNNGTPALLSDDYYDFVPNVDYFTAAFPDQFAYTVARRGRGDRHGDCQHHRERPARRRRRWPV